jgi:transglutaminase-like putative cysteine protease
VPRPVATALLVALPAWLVVSTWVRLESPVRVVGPALVAALALSCALVRPWRFRAPALVAATLVTLNVAFDHAGLRVASASPRRAGLAGGLPHGIERGLRDFYEVAVPFDPAAHPLMHGLVVLAVFGFCVALALAVAARRALSATLVLAAAVGWPATLRPIGEELVLGGLTLTAALLLLLGSATAVRRRLTAAVAAGAALVACALAASTAPAVAKQGFLDWQAWNLPTAGKRVSVTYVWNSNYDGIRFPDQKTVLLEIAAPSRPTYWRATTLDSFTGYGWVENVTFAVVPATGGRDLVGAVDPLLPRVRSQRSLVRQEIEVRALRDRHLVGASVPVAYRPGSLAPVTYAEGGIGFAARELSPRDRYTVWSFSVRPTPSALARSRPRYPPEITVERPFLSVVEGSVLPPFGSSGRDAWMVDFFRRSAYDERVAAYAPLYAAARRVTGRAGSPYAAAVALESWFRSSGGFQYDEQPPHALGPPLVDFVTRTKRGYCQHYAGAMALMLRYLGIPARVAAGFTSGRYDDDDGVWRVTDHDAHTWVEVWFEGFGWLPFDPTPSRGGLAAPYSTASPTFDAAGALGAVAAAAGPTLLDALRRLQNGAAGGGRRALPDSTPSGVAAGPQSAELRFSLVRGVLLVSGALVALLALIKLGVRQARFLRRDPRRRAAALRAELVGFLADQRVDVGPGTTLKDLATVVAARFGVSAERFAAAAERARFGPAAGAPRSLRRARGELRLLERALRNRLGPLRRARGLLSLRSLGIGG